MSTYTTAAGGNLNNLLHNVNTSLIYTPHTVTALSSLSSDFRANRHAPITTQNTASQNKSVPQHGVRGLRNLVKSDGASPILGSHGTTNLSDGSLTVLSGHSKGHLLAWKADTMSVVGTFTQEGPSTQHQQRASHQPASNTSDSASSRSGTPTPTTPASDDATSMKKRTTLASPTADNSASAASAAAGKLLSNLSAVNAIVVTDTKIVTVSGRYEENDTTNFSSASDANNLQAIHVWCKKTMKHLHILDGHEDRITCIAVNPMDENNILSGSADKMILEWNLPCRTPVAAYLGHEQGGVLQLSFLSPTTDYSQCKDDTSAQISSSVLRRHIFLSSGADGTVRLWKSAGHPTTPTPTSPLSGDEGKDGFTTANTLNARTPLPSDVKAMRREQRRNNINISRFAGAPLSRSGSTLGNYSGAINASSPNRESAGSRLGTPSHLQVSTQSVHNRALLSGFTLRQQLTLKHIPVLACVEVLPDVHGGQNVTYLEVTAAEIAETKIEEQQDSGLLFSVKPRISTDISTAKVAVITASSGGTVAIHEFHLSHQGTTAATGSTWSTANSSTATWGLVPNTDETESIYATLTFNQKVHRALTTDICWDKGLVFAASACDGLTIVHTPTKISLKLAAHTITKNNDVGTLTDAAKMKNLFAGTGIRHLGIDTTRKLLLCGCDNGSIKVLSYAAFFRETADLCSGTTSKTTADTDASTNVSVSSAAAVASIVDRNPEKMVSLVADISPHRGAVMSILLQQRQGTEEGTVEWERVITSGADRSLFIMDFNTLRDARVAPYQSGDLTLSQTTTLSAHLSKTTTPIAESASFLQAVDHGGFLWSLPEMVRQKGPGKTLESIPRTTAAQQDRGHRSQITAVRQFPKIGKLLSGSSAGELRFWSITNRPVSGGTTFITTTTTPTSGNAAAPPTSPPPEHQSPKRSNIMARSKESNTSFSTQEDATKLTVVVPDSEVFIDWAAAAADMASDSVDERSGGTSSMTNMIIQPHPTSNLLFEMYSVIDISEPVGMTYGGSVTTLAVVTLQTSHGPGSFSSGAIMIVNMDTEAVVSPLLKIGDGSGVPVRSIVVHNLNAQTTAPFFVIVQRRNGESALHQVAMNIPTQDDTKKTPSFTITSAVKVIANPQVAALTPHHRITGMAAYDGPNSLQHPHPVFTVGGGHGKPFSVLQINHNALELCKHRQIFGSHLSTDFESTSVFTMPFLDSTNAVLAQRALKYWRGNSNTTENHSRDAPEHKLYVRAVSCFTVIGGPTAFIAAVALDNGIVTLVGSEVAKSTNHSGEKGVATKTTAANDDLQMFNQHHRKFDIHFDGTVTEPGIRYFVLPTIDVASNIKNTASAREQSSKVHSTTATGGGSICTCLTASIEARILALGYSCGTALLWDMSNHTVTRRILTQLTIRVAVPASLSTDENPSSSRRTSLDAATTPRVTKGLTNNDGGVDDLDGSTNMTSTTSSDVPVSHIIVFGAQKRVVTCTAAALRIDTLLPRAILPN